jgi:hypothetical protein
MNDKGWVGGDVKLLHLPCIRCQATERMRYMRNIRIYDESQMFGYIQA